MKGEFHIRADLPCQYLRCQDFSRYYCSVSFPHQSVGGKVVSIAAFQAILTWVRLPIDAIIVNVALFD